MSFRDIAKAVFRLLSSYGLACVVMILMIVLTVLGTIDQARLGLYEVQRRYFTSLAFMYEAPGGVRVPMPGAYLLMAIFALNLFLGGFVRMRWRWNNVGLIVVHAGILFLLLSALITHHYGLEGHMTLAPDKTSNQFQSYNDWDLVVIDPRPADRDLVYRIPIERFAKARLGRKPFTFTSSQFPFDVIVTAYYPNAEPRPQGLMVAPPTPVVDGFYLQPLERETQNESNGPGAYVTLRDKSGGPERQAILWGFATQPFVAQAGGQPWRVDLERRRWTLPFSITLKKFTREFHPGTSIPAVFASDVIETENGLDQPVQIKMNEPFRHEGYTLFQSSYSEDPQTHQLSSTLEVVHNPADEYPLIALCVIGVGLFIHFTLRLLRHMKRSREAAA